jgi:transposase
LFPTAILFPVPDVELENVLVEEKCLTIAAVSSRHAAVCPRCQSISARIHSHYTRTIADVPCVGRALTLSLRVRRFFCDGHHCPQKTFAERFGPALPAYARRTARLRDDLCAVAFATGGEGGARLAHTLAMPASPRTLLRIMHAQPLPPMPAPRSVGLDEWAWKKGRNYGTICVDLERRQPIALLPDRSPDTVAAWLRAQPTIKVIARDRSGGYTDAATRGAPQAIQVADRWHLLKNLGDALEYFFHHHAAALKQAAQDLNAQAAAPTPDQRPVPTSDGATAQARAKAAGQARHTRAVERYQRVQDLHAKQVDVANIARQVGVSRQTVYRYLRLQQPPQPTYIHVARPHVIEPYKPYLIQRWNEGCRNALQMWRELRDQHGYTHPPRTVVRFVSELRKDSGVRRSFRSVAAAPLYMVEQERQRPITALQAVRLVVTRPEQRSAWQQAYLARLCERDPALQQAYDLAQSFVMMVRQRMGTRLDQWFVDVQASDVAELKTFAAGLQRDYAAVKNGVTMAESNGQTEAQIQRLKLLKRHMYGKAGFALLRNRVLYREQPYPVRSKAHHEQRKAA